MGAAWDRYAELAGGIAAGPRRTAEQVVQRLVQRGEMAADHAERAVDDLLGRSERNRKAVSELVQAEVEQLVNRIGLARQHDLDRLTERVEDQQRELEALRAQHTAAADASASKSSKPRGSAPGGSTSGGSTSGTAS